MMIVPLFKIGSHFVSKLKQAGLWMVGCCGWESVVCGNLFKIKQPITKGNWREGVSGSLV